MKAKLTEITGAHIAALNGLHRRIKPYSGRQVQDGKILASIREVAGEWFDVVRPTLQSANFPGSTIDIANGFFEVLLKLSRGRPSKQTLLETIGHCISFYKNEVIHQIEIGSFASSASLNIGPYIEGLSSDEGEYLAEAQRCLTVDALRGCVVLGWCAAIARIHSKIEELGFARFSEATAEMAAKTTGRFKPFNKRYTVESRSDLQRVFDTDILWVLEYLQLIDGNQHQRLRHCFEFRNNSAHPGLAPIKPANLYSFYSDISEIVLKNEKLAMAREPALSGG